MHSLVQTLDAACARLGLSGRRILAGVSGGADSMALLRGLRELRDRYRLELVVAHLNHRLRAAADGDADWLQAECRMLGVPVHVGVVDVASAARTAGRGLEETARSERYGFLEATAVRDACDVLAVAHTADDQAETILHHVLRGTGLAGLQGIARERGLDSGVRLVRPLLDASRAQVIDYLGSIGQEHRDDETNRDEAYTRNWIRQQLLPLLSRECNPQVAEALRRLGQQAADAQSVVEFAACELLERALEGDGPHECRLKWQPLAAAPRHLVREALCQLWRRRAWPRQGMGYDHWERLARIVLEGGAGQFPGPIDVRREGRWVVLERRVAGRTTIV